MWDLILFTRENVGVSHICLDSVPFIIRKSFRALKFFFIKCTCKCTSCLDVQRQHDYFVYLFILFFLCVSHICPLVVQPAGGGEEARRGGEKQSRLQTLHVEKQNI